MKIFICNLQLIATLFAYSYTLFSKTMNLSKNLMWIYQTLPDIHFDLRAARMHAVAVFVHY